MALFFASLLISSVTVLTAASAQNATITLSPLKQFENGVSASNVKCKDGLVLIIKTSDSNPACVKPSTAQKLGERGWGILEMFLLAKLSDDQVARIVKSDLTKHLPNLSRVIIPDIDGLSDNPNYPKHPLSLIYVTPNNIEYFINNTSYSIEYSCSPQKNWCWIMDKSAMNATSGKLVYLVDLLWYTSTNISGPTYYLINAQNGGILFSSLVKNIPTGKNTTEYRP